MLWQFPVDTQIKTRTPDWLGEFFAMGSVGLRFSQETVAKYRDCLRQVWIWWGEREVKEMTPQGLLSLKQTWISRDLSVSRQTSLLLALKRFLQFCKEQKGCELQLNPADIRPPRRPRNEVLYLTAAEVEILLRPFRCEPLEGKYIFRAFGFERSLSSCLHCSPYQRGTLS